MIPGSIRQFPTIFGSPRLVDFPHNNFPSRSWRERDPAVTEGFPAIPESPGIEPTVSVAMVRTVRLEEPTLLEEVLAQRILDQTVNCGEKSPKIAGPSLVKSWGTPMVTKDRPIYTGFQSTVPITQYGEWEGHFGKAPGYRGDIETTDIESSEPGLDSPVSNPGRRGGAAGVGPPGWGRRGGAAGGSFCVESGGLRDGVFFVWLVGSWR